MTTKLTRKKHQNPGAWITGPDPRVHAMYRVYIQQRNQANYRKEGWAFTFEVWCEMWGNKFESRGKKSDQFAMTRTDITKKWSVDNCFIASRTEVMMYAQAESGRFKIQTPKGIFPSQALAAEANGLSPYEIRKKRTTNPDEFYRIVKEK